MSKHYNNVKTFLIFGIIFFSSISIFVPTTSAQGIVGLSSYVDVFWEGNATGRPIIPRGEMRTVDIGIRYGITQGWFLAKMLFVFHLGRQVNIMMEITDKSPWCTAGLQKQTITTVVDEAILDLTNQINIRLDEDAPAYGGGFINVKITVGRIGLIEGIEQGFTLEFTPDYLPLISTTLQDTNTKRIGPMDTAVFPIEVTNLGNARTKVYLNVDKKTLPEGWIAIVDDDIIIDEGEGSKNIAYLTIRPPKSLGYHDEYASIVVELTPARAENTEDRGTTEQVTVVVESRGISIIGIEIIAPVIIVIIAVIIFLIYFFMLKKR